MDKTRQGPEGFGLKISADQRDVGEPPQRRRGVLRIKQRVVAREAY